MLAFFKKTGQTRRSVTDGIYSMAWNRSKATLDAVPAKEEGKESKFRNSEVDSFLIENVEAEAQARPWKSGVEKDQKNEKISLTSEGCR